VKVLDCSLLGPDGCTMHLADFGADVVKVEAPGGDYVRQTGWPIIAGASVFHWQLNRGKRSILLDLKKDVDKQTFLRLVARADVLVEGMRPGALDKLGFTWDKLRAANPRLVMCSVSGYGSVGPYANMAAHSFGFDSWAGLAPSTRDERGFAALPPTYAPIGLTVGPLFAALGILACLLQARATGQGRRIEVSQGAASAAVNWQMLVGQRAHEKLAGGKSVEPLPMPGTAVREAVRYQYYASKDGCVLFMPSERKFWRNFCEAAGCMDLFERFPGKEYAEHESGNHVLRRTLSEVFLARTTAEWLDLGLAANFPIAPVYDPAGALRDPHFIASMNWIPARAGESETIGMPVRFLDDALPVPRRAPDVGQHTGEVMADWLGEGRGEN
jgi:crotonobetainyl-CoA:carnitine CoA-transferase CaiB-like acyl-CoA transferase